VDGTKTLTEKARHRKNEGSLGNSLFKLLQGMGSRTEVPVGGSWHVMTVWRGNTEKKGPGFDQKGEKNIETKTKKGRCLVKRGFSKTGKK